MVHTEIKLTQSVIIKIKHCQVILTFHEKMHVNGHCLYKIFLVLPFTHELEQLHECFLLTLLHFM